MDQKREAEQKLAEPFRELMAEKRATYDAIDQQLKENRGRVRGWSAYERSMRDHTLATFETWENQLNQSATPPKHAHFKRARRRLWFYEAKTWLHWRGMVYRLQILGMWTVRLGIIAGIGYLIYRLISGLL